MWQGGFAASTSLALELGPDGRIPRGVEFALEDAALDDGLEVFLDEAGQCPLDVRFLQPSLRGVGPCPPTVTTAIGLEAFLFETLHRLTELTVVLMLQPIVRPPWFRLNGEQRRVKCV